MTWTPGPWEDKFPSELIRTEADIRLISLAPEMAELLESVAANMNPKRTDLASYASACDYAEEARALLARARGEA